MMSRTIWIAGVCLVVIGGLAATRMMSGGSAEAANDTTASLSRMIIPGEDTLSDADRGATAPEADDNPFFLPIESTIVRAAHAEMPAPKKRAVVRPAKAQAAATAKSASASKPGKAAAVPCRQLDPIARFLVSANLAPRCEG